MKPLNSKSGVVPVIVLYILGALALTQLVPNWRIGNLFAPKSPTADLAKAQGALEKANADADAATAKLEAAKLADAQAKISLLQGSQQYVTGAASALAKAPVSPEVSLASDLLDRASLGLQHALGDLPADRKAQILAIVEGALSAKQAEVDAANDALAARDKELELVTAEKKTLETQLPLLQQQAATFDAKAQAAQTLVTAKTAEVVAYADKAAAKEQEAGSLCALLGKVAWGVGLLVAGLFLVNFMLPCLAQEFPGIGWLVALNKTTKSITSAHL